ncbi:hypothetical protein CVT24_001425 [Panaeolus cyanescens]|uniref:Uncharacterized protein n=1 Tax=Panaeolus cyanescens TaxID=181874 RepID=A0A409YU51_9AGAR|nr:hypothetical protein CVT24_001425 [Panaeolus cyanescens]
MSVTPVSIENIKLTITVGPNVDPTKFEEPIDRMLDKITEIRAMAPNPLVIMEFNVTTLKDEMDPDAFVEVKETLAKLVKALRTLPYIISSSLNFTRNHVSKFTLHIPDIIQQDQVCFILMGCFYQKGRVPDLNLGITTHIEDEWVWGFTTKYLSDMNNKWKKHVPAIKGLCVVLNFHDNNSVVNLDYDVRYRKRLLLGELRELRKNNRHLVLKHYIGMGIGGELVEHKRGIERMKKLRARRKQ